MGALWETASPLLARCLATLQPPPIIERHDGLHVVWWLGHSLWERTRLTPASRSGRCRNAGSASNGPSRRPTIWPGSGPAGHTTTVPGCRPRPKDFVTRYRQHILEALIFQPNTQVAGVPVNRIAHDAGKGYPRCLDSREHLTGQQRVGGKGVSGASGNPCFAITGGNTINSVI